MRLTRDRHTCHAMDPTQSSTALPSLTAVVPAPGQKEPVRIRWGWLLGPTIVLLAILGLITLVAPSKGSSLFAYLLVSLVGGGKFVILGALKDTGTSPYEIMLVVMGLEVSQGMAVLYNVDLVRRLPYVGKGLETLRMAAKRLMEKHPIVRKLALGTMVAFVAAPLTGTGAIGGVIFSAVLGIKKSITLLGVVLGSFLGNVILAVGVDFGQKQFEERLQDTATQVIGLAILILVVVYLSRMLARTIRELAREAEEQKQFALKVAMIRLRSLDVLRADPRLAIRARRPVLAKGGAAASAEGRRHRIRDARKPGIIEVTTPPALSQSQHTTLGLNNGREHLPTPTVQLSQLGLTPNALGGFSGRPDPSLHPLGAALVRTVGLVRLPLSRLNRGQSLSVVEDLEAMP